MTMIITTMNIKKGSRGDLDGRSTAHSGRNRAEHIGAWLAAHAGYGAR
jgi:hypothetical protein